MKHAWLQRSKPIAIAAALILVTTGLSFVSLRMLSPMGSSALLVVVAGMLYISVGLLVPVHVLPALSLLTYAVLPTRLLPETPLTSLITPAALFMVMWAARRALGLGNSRPRTANPDTNTTLRTRWRRTALLFTGLFAVWTVFSLFRSSAPQTSWSWTISVAVTILLPLLFRDSSAEAELLAKWWIRIGAVAGIYAALELATQTNFVYGTLYRLVGASDSQHWSVYRAEVSFSHPLFAGTFLAVATTLAVATWLRTGHKATLVYGLCSAVGVVATISRGSMIATVVAIAAAFIAIGLAKGQKNIGRASLLVIVASAALVGVNQIGAFTERSNSREAMLSAGARDTGLQVGLQAAQSSGWLGAGPGMSGQTASSFGTVVIENSFLQLLISLGIPGLIFFVGILVSSGVFALRNRNIAVAAGLLAFTIAISGYNAIDAVRSTHLLLGLLLLMALASRADYSLTDTVDKESALKKSVRHPAVTRA